MTTTLPDALADPTRTFVSRTHGLMIGGESVAPTDGTRFETLDPATGRPIAVPSRRARGRRSRRRRRARGVRGRRTWRKMPAPQRGAGC